MVYVIAWAATAIGQIPDLGNLLAGEVVFLYKEFGQAAIDIPAPALAATRALLH